MSIFEDLEESVLSTYNSSNKQSLNDVSLDLEERDKIIHEITTSISSKLNVDYSDFSNHIFFDSAYASVNFAAQRIVESYPIDGELKEKNSWHETNSGFENWFFEQWPKQQGFLFLQSGSNFASVKDFEGILNYNSASRSGKFCVDAVVRPYVNIPSNAIYPIVSFVNTASSDQGFSLFLRNVSGEKYLFFKISNAAGTNLISASFDSYISSSVPVSAKLTQLSMSIFIDGAIAKEAGLVHSGTTSFGQDFSVGYMKSGSVAHFYSGSIDDVRFWNGDRSNDLIIKNSKRTVYSNHSGGLRLYWKFNQPAEYGTKIVDYSGYGLHGQLTGSQYSFSTNLVSGTLGSWFFDSGDPILSLNNSRVENFLDTQRTSGSNYDDSNQNMIFNLVPSHFTEMENSDYQQYFLLLTARHYDRIKLYIDHLSNITKITNEKYNGPPENLLDLAGKHHGIDIGDIFTGVDPLQFYFGENINSVTGSLDVSLREIRETIKRNVLGNLPYILKSRSTRQSVKAALSSLGLDENLISFVEYTDFSGGIKTTYTPRTIEARVANFLTSSNIYISSSAYTTSSVNTHQIRAMFFTGSPHVSQSVLSFHSASSLLLGLSVERDNLTSSTGKIRLQARSGSGALVSISSSAELFNNKWINFTIQRNQASNLISFRATSADRSGLLFSSSAQQSFVLNSGSVDSVFLGTSGTNYFSGFMNEYRAWHGYNPTDLMLDRWGLDWTSTEVENVLSDITKLKHHLKLNDFTSSTTGGGPIHDYITSNSGSSYFGFSTSSVLAFPGKYIDINESLSSYDLTVDNDKIRIRSGSAFSVSDRNIDIPFVSLNFSPINSLNKEIFKWVGDISKLSNVIGDPINQYRETNANLDAIRGMFFKEKVSSKIDYEKFSELIQWFDSNFGQLISQLIPVDVASSISSFVVEPHLLEINSLKKSAASNNATRNLNLDATIRVAPVLTASSATTELSLADPGRFGAFVSASGEITKDVYFFYPTSSEGLNYANRLERNVLTNVIRNNYENDAPRGYGNGNYNLIITGSNYLKNTLNVDSAFMVSGVYYINGGAKGTNYLSSSTGEPMSPFTGAMNGYQDARWLWMQTSTSASVSQIVDEEKEQFVYDYGIGYGGMWGQLRFRSNKSTVGTPQYPSGSKEFGSRRGFIGENTVVGSVKNSEYISVFGRDGLKTTMLWPINNAFDGVEVFCTGSAATFFSDGSSAASFGQVIDIENFKTLNIEILGRTNNIGGGSNSTKIVFEIKFQFFSRELPGDYGFETVMSSSHASAAAPFYNNMMSSIYRFSTDDLPKGKLSNFNLSFERSLPKQKFMRVFLTPTTAEAENYGSFFVLVKGILSGDERIKDDLSIV